MGLMWFSLSIAVYRSIGNVTYNLMVLRWKMPLVHELLKKLGISRWMFYLNFFDIVHLIARRR